MSPYRLLTISLFLLLLAGLCYALSWSLTRRTLRANERGDPAPVALISWNAGALGILYATGSVGALGLISSICMLSGEKFTATPADVLRGIAFGAFVVGIGLTAKGIHHNSLFKSLLGNRNPAVIVQRNREEVLASLSESAAKVCYICFFITIFATGNYFR